MRDLYGLLVPGKSDDAPLRFLLFFAGLPDHLASEHPSTAKYIPSLSSFDTFSLLFVSLSPEGKPSQEMVNYF